jgi:hypothetical protein
MKFGKELILSGLLCLGIACGDKAANVSADDGGGETPIEAGSGPECAVRNIRLNFKGVFADCSNLTVYDPSYYCPTGKEGRVLIEGFKGTADRDSEIKAIVNLFRCFFKPLKIGVQLSDKAQDLKSFNNPSETLVNIGGKVPSTGTGAIFSYFSGVIDSVSGKTSFSVQVGEEAIRDGNTDLKAKPKVLTGLAFREIARTYILGLTKKNAGSILDSSIPISKIDLCSAGFATEEAELLSEKSISNCPMSATEEEERVKAWEFKGRCIDECTDLQKK